MKLNRYRNYGALFCVVAACSAITFCVKHKSKKQPAATLLQAQKDFKLGCPGQSKCSGSELSVTNISHKKYENLIIICTDKDDPNESERDPHHNFPFSLDPGETKCMEAQNECANKKHSDKDLGNYFTLIQLDSSNDPVWKLGDDCGTGPKKGNGEAE